MIYLLLFLVLLGCAPLLGFFTAVAAVVLVALRALVVAVVVLVQIAIVGISALIAAGSLVGQRIQHRHASWQ